MIEFNGILTVTICGSMRFYDRMVEVAEQWTAQGMMVHFPFRAELSEEDHRELHHAKIDDSQIVVFVVGTPEYWGESGIDELNYAESAGKTIVVDREVSVK